MKNIITELKSRSLIKDLSDEAKLKKAQVNKSAIYCGFDPTASALHLGNLIQLLTLKRCEKLGLKPLVVIGGATAKIGDPSGKTKMRVPLSKETIAKNVLYIRKFVQKYFPTFRIFNNEDWYESMTLEDFLKEVGFHFNVNYLLAKETIKSRLQKGLTFTEFTYNLMQAYDFYFLNKHKIKCNVQLGGSDQWGNIVSGIEIIKQKNNNVSEACGFTTPLLLQKNKTKFGKTETGTIWLDAKLTTPFRLYQFLLNQEDDIIDSLLNYFTFYDSQAIKNMTQRKAKQQALADFLTEFLHGQAGLASAKKISSLLFNKDSDYSNLTKKDIEVIASLIPSFKHYANTSLKIALIESNIVASGRECREFCANRALKINNAIIQDSNLPLSSFTPVANKYFIIKKGKQSNYLIEINN